MSRFLSVALVVGCFVALSQAKAEAVATFQFLQDLPGGVTQSEANAVSSDGTVVVGYGVSGTFVEGVYWTNGAGAVSIGSLPGGSPGSVANANSSDGSVIVGYGDLASTPEAFRWTSATGMVGLGDLPGGDVFSEATGVSSDGSVVVGYGFVSSGSEAFRWTSDTGMVGLGDLPGGGIYSRARGVSSDGSVVVGESNSASGTEAFRWTSFGGMIGLGGLPGGPVSSIATAVSSDGNVIVGVGQSVSGEEAFRWTSETGMVGLGDLPGGFFQSRANAVSADGQVIVGTGYGNSGPRAFIWTENLGIQSLASMLQSYGATPPGFDVLENATGVTINGNVATVVGRGFSSIAIEAFLSTLPIVSASLDNAFVSLTPGLTSDTLTLDISATRLLYGNIGQYEFDFTSDGVYDLVLHVGTPLFDSYWDASSESFIFPEVDFRNYYSAINAGEFSSLSFNTTIRMTHDNGISINTSQAIVTVVPEMGSLGLLASVCFITTSIVVSNRQRGKCSDFQFIWFR